MINKVIYPQKYDFIDVTRESDANTYKVFSKGLSSGSYEYPLSIYSDIIPKIMAEVVNIVEKKLSYVEKPDDISEIEKELFIYFSKVAKYFGKKLNDALEMPAFIDSLKQGGHISEKTWKTLLDLISTIDVLKYQEKIFESEKKLLHEIVSDLRKVDEPPMYKSEDSTLNYLITGILLREPIRLSNVSFTPLRSL
jgi:hypothetical protein